MNLSNEESNYAKVYGVDSFGNTTFKGDIIVPIEKTRVRCSFPHRRYNPKLDVCKSAIKHLKAHKQHLKAIKRKPFVDVWNEFRERVEREFIDKIQ